MAPGFAVVDRFHGYRHVFSLKQRLQGHENLLGQSLLHLGPLGKESDDAINLALTNDLASRQISCGPASMVTKWCSQVDVRSMSSIMTISSTILFSITEILGKFE